MIRKYTQSAGRYDQLAVNYDQSAGEYDQKITISDGLVRSIAGRIDILARKSVWP